MLRRTIALALLSVLVSTFFIGSVFAEQTTATLASDKLQGEMTVVGIVDRSAFALYDVDSARICNVDIDDRVLAIARTESDDYYRVYTSSPSCEGVVWISSDTAISWETPSDLASLPVLVAPNTPVYLDELPDYEAICATAMAEDAPTATLENPDTLFLPGGWSFIPSEFLAETESNLDAVICLNATEIELSTCPIPSGEEEIEVPRIQENLTVTMVAFDGTGVIASQVFEGQTPPSCPFGEAEAVPIHGTPPERHVWGAWVVAQMLGVETDSPSFRTYSASQTLNARAEPTTNSAILGRLSIETPVNLIGRNEEGDWVVALLPDMSKAWLFADLLNVAVQIEVEDLPVYSGPAEDVPVPVR